jgi:hypothetical protein
MLYGYSLKKYKQKKIRQPPSKIVRFSLLSVPLRALKPIKPLKETYQLLRGSLRIHYSTGNPKTRAGVVDIRRVVDMEAHSAVGSKYLQVTCHIFELSIFIFFCI